MLRCKIQDLDTGELLFARSSSQGQGGVYEVEYHAGIFAAIEGQGEMLEGEEGEEGGDEVEGVLELPSEGLVAGTLPLGCVRVLTEESQKRVHCCEVFAVPGRRKARLCFTAALQE